MATDKAFRLLSIGLLVALSAPCSNSQLISTPGNSSGEDPAPPAARPATPAETPPREPKVTCKGDQLSISAENSTLGSILSAVRACIGVQIDMPEGASGSRTFEELGPGPARQVLDSLLHGTNFDYVIGSSDANPQKVESVLLMVRATEVAPSALSSADRNLTPARRAWLESRQHPRGLSPAAATDESQSAPDESTKPIQEDAAPPAPDPATASAPAPAADQPAQPSQPTQPPAVPDSTPASLSLSSGTTTPAASANANPTPSQDKSAAERISDMEQLFQQRRQMNQSQNQQTPQPQ